LRGRVTGTRVTKSRQTTTTTPSTTILRRISLVVGATSRPSDRSPTGWFSLSRKHGYVASDRSKRRHCARSMLSHSYCTITLASHCRREGCIYWATRAGCTGSNSLTVCYVTYISKTQREGPYLNMLQQPRSRADAVGTLHRLTDLHAILLSHA
jgi:hypothetical protein